jgi:NhaA family Na+:H+ antiporter
MEGGEMASSSTTPGRERTRRGSGAVDRRHDHVRGGPASRGSVTAVLYGDYLCPYCRRLRPVLDRLRKTLGDRLAYVYRHFPNERAHPGAELAAMAAEAAGRQGKFWEMHDALYEHERPVGEEVLIDLARSVGLDLERFRADLKDERLKDRITRNVAEGRRSGVTGTPTIFVDGERYDGAWDFYSMLEGLNRPLGVRLQHTARAFANLPSSAGLVLLAAAAAALICANSALAPLYRQFVEARIGIGPQAGGVWLSVAQWCAEGLLGIFFLIVGLEIRRELTAGSLHEPRAAAGPVIAAIGGVIAPAAVYLAFNRGPTAPGWAVTDDTGIAFTLAILAVFGARASTGVKTFVAAYAVVADILSILILTVFYPQAFQAVWLAGAAAAFALMVMLSRWRVYPTWPYWGLAAILWLMFHLAGVSGALTGIALAISLPTRPSPSAAPLLAQAATALAELEQTERDLKRDGKAGRRVEHEPIWDWASRNLSAAAARLQSPAERVERQLEPWSTYIVLPLFAFTSSGVSLGADLGGPDTQRIFLGVMFGLAVGKPLGMVGATWIAERAKLAMGPPEASAAAFIGAACLCGIGDPLSILTAEHAFTGGEAAAAKLGVLGGSVLAAALGALAMAFSPPPRTMSGQPSKGSS